MSRRRGGKASVGITDPQSVAAHLRGQPSLASGRVAGPARAWSSTRSPCRELGGKNHIPLVGLGDYRPPWIISRCFVLAQAGLYLGNRLLMKAARAVASAALKGGGSMFQFLRRLRRLSWSPFNL